MVYTASELTRGHAPHESTEWCNRVTCCCITTGAAHISLP